MSWYIHVYSPTTRQSSSAVHFFSKSKNILNHRNHQMAISLGCLITNHHWLTIINHHQPSQILEILEIPSWGKCWLFPSGSSIPTPQSEVNTRRSWSQKKGPNISANYLRLTNEVSILCATKSQGKGWKLSDLLLDILYIQAGFTSMIQRFQEFQPLISHTHWVAQTQRRPRCGHGRHRQGGLSMEPKIRGLTKRNRELIILVNENNSWLTWN